MMTKVRVYSVNKKARHDFHIEETLEMGMALMGSEVKSIREGRVNLRDSYAQFKGDELYLVGVHISPYSHGSYFNHEPMRERKLLAHKRELRRLRGKVTERGFTLVPLRIYLTDRSKIKVEIGLARGKLQRDRRQDMQERDMRREAERALKERSR
jgi:SsrA-binding protein